MEITNQEINKQRKIFQYVIMPNNIILNNTNFQIAMVSASTIEEAHSRINQNFSGENVNATYVGFQTIYKLISDLQIPVLNFVEAKKEEEEEEEKTVDKITSLEAMAAMLKDNGWVCYKKKTPA